MWKAPSALVAIVLVLLALGVVMLASTSSVKGDTSFHDPHYFVKRQVVWLVIALIVGALASCVDYHWWQRLAIPLVVLSLILLVMVFVPHIGMKIGGSRRWLRLGFMNLQPSEIAKLASVVGLASWMAAVRNDADTLKRGLLQPGVGLAAILGLIFLEPDYGTTLLVAVVGGAILYAGGTRPGYLLVAGVLGLCGFALAVMSNTVRMARILAFVMPEKYRDAAYQLGQSKDAFIMGGPWGVGFGESLQKHFYLPEAHTDFILAIIGEELGLPATAMVAALFLAFLICGLIISHRAPDMFGRLLAFGITMMIALQSAINIGVVTGCLPTKGLPLPFISYGGSSLLMALVGVGVLINVARHSSIDLLHDDGHAIKDRLHRL